MRSINGNELSGNFPNSFCRKEEKSKPKRKKIYLTETLTKKDIEIYWKRFEDVLPTQEDDQYWDNFEKKLMKKFDILKGKSYVRRIFKM